MRNELKKPLVIAVMMLAIISVIVIAVTWKDKNGSDTNNSTVGSNVAYNNYTQEGVDETPVEESQSSTPSSTTSKRLTYTEALKIYGAQGTGYHYQFVNCSGTPGKLTMKKGTKFLLDNRDNASHKFTVGSQNFTLGKYGFTVVTARDLGTYNILCDGGGAASIFVQS